MSPDPLEPGIVTPVLTMLPRAHATWEETATFDDVVAVVQEAERLGYHHCTCSEHVGMPRDVAAVRGSRYYDPLATFGALGALTSRIRFAVHVVVLGYHHPLALAKRYGTLDVVTYSAPRSPTGAPGPTTPCGPCGPHCRSRSRRTAATTTTSRASWSTRTRAIFCRAASDLHGPYGRLPASSRDDARLTTAGVGPQVGTEAREPDKPGDAGPS